MKPALVIALFALAACRPRQAAPADRLDSYQDDEGVVHIGGVIPERFRSRDARLWKSGEEDFHRIGSRCVAPDGSVIACRD